MELVTKLGLKNNQESIFQKLMGQTYNNASQIFSLILPVQFVILVLLAFFVTPYTWVGNEASINQTIITTIGLGLLAMGLPVYLSKNNPESPLSRYSVAIGQMISSAILIDIFGGRIEAHFHIFISLAFLSIYKDFKVILVATVVVVIDHLTRGFLFPFSLFGINTVDFIRIVEHALYVVALDLGLFVMITNSTNETKTIAIDKGNLEEQQNIAQNALKESNELIEIQNSELTILTSAMDELAAGKIDVKYNTYNGDKFPIYQHLSDAFNSFVEIQSNVVSYANSLAKGDLNNNINARSNDDHLVMAMNTVSESLLNILRQIENVSFDLSIGNLYSRIKNENLQGSYQDLANNFNASLDVVVHFFNVNSNLMIANAERNITFINNPLLEVIRKYEGDFRKSFPSFDSNKLIGISIDGFHKKPEYNKGILNNLTNTHSAIINVGDRKFNLVINPVKDKNGVTLAFIVNLVDITDQINFNNNLAKLTNELNEGRLDYRINPNEQKGEFVGLAESINEMVSNVINPLNVTSNYLDRISKGDIPEQISTVYLGDYNIIKNNINKLISTMNTLIAELSNMSNQHDLGDIDIYANPNIFEGAFSQVVIQTNNMVKSHIDVKKKAMYVFGEFGNGNFEADLEKLPGKRVFINNTINAVRDNLVHVSQEMAQLIDTTQRGELSFRADANRFKGDWSNMIKSINRLIDNIVDPINDAGIALSELAQGDLTTRIDGNYGGDFEKLKNNINFLAESLEQVISKVVESVQTTASTSHQLTAAAESMAAAAQEQSAQTDDVASAVEEMSRTITENASSATRTATLAEENGQVALKGGKVVNDTVNKMKDIAKVVKNTSQSIEKLGDSSKAIGEIISVIDDIADQTNLLALNAAIEAARAGEQGRGFAVVADEVRKLAERTSDATKEIAKMIKGIQQETQDAVLVMQTGTKEVENGIKLADEAGSSLKLIVESSQDLIHMITQISAASEEQSATSEEISKNVMSISKVVSDSARQIEEIADSSENLSKQTLLLTELMGQFQIESGRNNRRKLSNSTNNRNLLSN